MPFFLKNFFQKKFKAIFEWIKGHFWNTIWTSTFAQNSKKIYKRNQDEPKRAIISFKEPTTAFKKP